jgi:hypothetical protein
MSVDFSASLSMQKNLESDFENQLKTIYVKH